MNKLCLCDVFQRIWALVCQKNIQWEANMSTEHVCVHMHVCMYLYLWESQAVSPGPPHLSLLSQIMGFR